MMKIVAKEEILNNLFFNVKHNETTLLEIKIQE